MISPCKFHQIFSSTFNDAVTGFNQTESNQPFKFWPSVQKVQTKRHPAAPFCQHDFKEKSWDIQHFHLLVGTLSHISAQGKNKHEKCFQQFCFRLNIRRFGLSLICLFILLMIIDFDTSVSKLHSFIQSDGIKTFDLLELLWYSGLALCIHQSTQY